MKSWPLTLLFSLFFSRHTLINHFQTAAKIEWVKVKRETETQRLIKGTKEKKSTKKLQQIRLEKEIFSLMMGMTKVNKRNTIAKWTITGLLLWNSSSVHRKQWNTMSTHGVVSSVHERIYLRKFMNHVTRWSFYRLCSNSNANSFPWLMTSSIIHLLWVRFDITWRSNYREILGFHRFFCGTHVTS